ncbi:MAG TPA: phosphate/phosphite/phosphonate ABC transporter substrate-binding protein, partial [Nitrospirae bacterium]|nr:phosphate/phosphite/phosphonate ABC transporter substrate-binding protein [Nitrospirota bacterium]
MPIAVAALLLLLFPALTTSPARADEYLHPDQEFLIGLIPEENIFKQMQRHKPLGEYLSKELGIPVRFTILSRYPHIITRFVNRDLDGAFFGAFTGVLALETLFVEPIARPVNIDGSMTTKGYLFTHVDSGISNVKQMRGKSIAYVDQVTATGYLYAQDLLRSKGIKNTEGFFKREEYTGGHDTAVYTVLAGRTELGVAKARIVDQVRERDPMAKEQIKILYRSPDLPDNTLHIRKDLPEDFKLKLKNVLLSMHNNPKGKEVLKKFAAIQFTIA